MKFVEFRDVPVASIRVGPRLRDLDEVWVEALAGMIESDGLQHPVSVFPVGRDGFALMAGGHRLAAFKRLKRTSIPAGVFEPESDEPGVEARIYEILENLGRRELSALDRAAHLAELKAAYEKLHPGAKRGGDRKSRAAKNQSEIFSFCFSEAAAQRCGLSRRSIEIAVAIHNGLMPGVRDLIRALPIADNAALLRCLAKLDTPMQSRVARLLASGDAKSIAAAMAKMNGGGGSKLDADAQFTLLLKVWKRTGAKARRRFLVEIGARQ